MALSNKGAPKKAQFYERDIPSLIKAAQPIILIGGEDERSLYTIVEKAVEPLKEYQKSRFYLQDETSILKLREYLCTPDFFNDKRIAILDAFSAPTNGWKILSEAIKIQTIIPNTTLFVLTGRVDKLPAAAKLILNEAATIKVWSTEKNDLRRQALALLKEGGKDIDDLALQEIVKRSGNSVGTLNLQMKKLLALSVNHVKMGHVQQLFNEREKEDESYRFQLISSVSQGNEEKAQYCYAQLEEDKSAPFPILAPLINRFRLAIFFRILMDEYPEKIRGLVPHCKSYVNSDAMESLAQANIHRSKVGNIIRQEINSISRDFAHEFVYPPCFEGGNPWAIAPAIILALRGDGPFLSKALYRLEKFELEAKTGLIDPHLQFPLLINRLCQKPGLKGWIPET